MIAPMNLRVIAVGALILASVTAGCGRRDEPKGDSGTPPTKEYVNNTDPQWVSRSTPNAKVAVVFIHGLTGGTLETWTNANGKTFFELLKATEGVGSQVDVFAFGFTSNVLKSGSLDVREAANKLHESLKFNKVLDYPGIVFVGHSMGGLVTLRYLVNHRELVSKVPTIVLFATPQEGAQIASVGKYVLNNDATRQLIPLDGNDFLKLLNDDWRLLPARPKVVCGYEKAPIAETVIVVPFSSSTRFCDGASLAIGEATHFTIVKPDRLTHDSVVLLVNALNDYAVGKNLTANLETPDFIAEADHWKFTLSDPNGKSAARLINTGKAKLQYLVGEVSDPALYLWPDDTPRDLAGGSTDRLSMALGFGATASEYRFTLKSDVTEPKQVVVHVKDVEALRAKRAALQDTAVQALNSHLENPSNLAALTAPGKTAEDARNEAVGVVQAAIAKQAPDLGPGAQWTLTADVLAASNWPQLAQSALREAEKQSPSVAKSPGGQRLAAQISASAGVDRVFATVELPKSSTPLVVKTLPHLTDPQQLANSAQLATKLQQVPALKGFGLSLQGDVYQAQGNREAARRAYIGAAEFQNTPSIATRLRSLDKPGAAVKGNVMIADIPSPKNTIAVQPPPADKIQKVNKAAVAGVPS